MAFSLKGLTLGKRGASASEGFSATTILDTSVAQPGTSGATTPAKSASTRPLAARLKTLLAVFLGLAVVATALIIYKAISSTNAALYAYGAGQMRTLSQQIAHDAQLALQGNTDAIASLKKGRDEFTSLLGALSKGGKVEGKSVSASPGRVQPALASLQDSWGKIDKDAGTVIAQAKNLAMLNTTVATINASNPELVSLAEQLTNLKLQSGASAREVAVASHVVMLTQRIAKNANALLAGNVIDPTTALQLGKDASSFHELTGQLQQLSGNGEQQAKAAQLDKTSRDGLAAINDVIANIEPLIQAKDAGARVVRQAPQLLSGAETLADGYNAEYTGLDPVTLLIAVIGLAGLGVLGFMLRIYNSDLATRGAEAERLRIAAENERNQSQQAILRLMNEMGDLADGDLTIRATVTEDITGAIADSVNYTVEELSVLVRRINDAATRVTTATESAQHTSAELLKASERQTQQLKDAGATAEAMARSMTEASDRAMASAQVARQSLDAARKGADAVENTIKGMNEIRDKIQETSKRIKRLGESSQEIGEIVELISDITEQTNVLALNAAIQAASAGEAGRGFTVVAEEVQRLAERSGEATKQIAAIVKTIQADTQDAVGAMENATRDVVSGAQLSDAAGQALAEIGEVSMETARLIEQISGDTHAQAAKAAEVAESMKNILGLTEMTTRGTQQTAVSIGELADLAIELKGSVSGFKV